MSNEVTVKQESVVATQEELAAWGTGNNLSSKDVVIPKILPMQGLSQMVADGKASMGEFRDSVNGSLVGSIDKPFSIIPFHVEKVWDIKEEQADGSYKYSRSVAIDENPLSPGYNDNLPWEGEENGLKVQRIRRMNFYVLLPSEVEANESIPYVLSFKSTSIKEGKKLFTQMYVRNLRAQLPPPGFVVEIGGQRVKNDKGTFIVPTVKPSRKATAAEVSEAFSWFKMVKKGAVKVDNSDLHTDAAEVTDVESSEF